MTDARRALAHLLELADKGPALRAALAVEVAELLAAWPEHCPPPMRAACEALLEKATREIGAEAIPPFAADEDPGENEAIALDGGLVAAAREATGLRRVLADRLGISLARADGILADPSGRELAVACKGASLGRPVFSALAILADEAGTNRKRRLAVYGAVAARDAKRTLDAWRAMDRFSHAAE